MEDNLKKRAIQGAALVIVSHGLSQVLRLAGNLILSRLLIPEFFGIMALARTFITGLHLFSDIGLRPGIIRSPRGNDSVFLNTAWTLGVLRGIALWILTLVLALPISKIYGSPILAGVIPIAGINAIFYGLNSTSIYTLNKDIKLGKVTIMEFSSQFIALICMIALAYYYKNVWSLVIGTLIGALSTTIWSHFLEEDRINHFTFEKKAINELLSFGKWIFVSTAMMFLATQADRFLLGKIFPMNLFGVYSIAVIFAETPKQIISQLSSKVIYPLISKYSHLPRTDLRQKILQKRKLLLAPLALLIALLTGFGDLLIDFLYDERYKQAGWMLSLLALGMWPLVLYSTIDRSLYVIGKPKYSATGNCFKFLFMIIFIPVSFKFAGFPGAVLAVALNDFPVYIVTCFGLYKENLSCLIQDALATAILTAMLGSFFAIRLILNIDLPDFLLIMH